MLDADESSEKSLRRYAFEPTPAVAASRSRPSYVSCPVCNERRAEYLFIRVGVRYVRCPACGLVYVSPVGGAGPNYFDIAASAPFVSATDRALCVRDFELFLAELSMRFEAEGRAAPQKSVLLGRSLPEFSETDTARRLGLVVPHIDDAAFARLALDGSLAFAEAELSSEPALVILHELLEACADPAAVLNELSKVLPASTTLAVTYSNVDSIPARFMRRYWPAFFEVKRAFFSTANLSLLMAGAGFGLRSQFGYPATRTAAYVLERVTHPGTAKWLVRSHVADVTLPLRTGHRVAVFRRAAVLSSTEKLSVVLPVFNEARYAADVIDALLEKDLAIDKELIIVESNSTDGTREIVKRYENVPGVTVIYEDKPRGKGHAVKTGLRAATGSILLIQDADFEYDVDDYDALLEPILQRRTSFVLGSRSLGLDDWKVRRFSQNAFKGFLMNAAQVGFAHTFNFLYQQRTTDVNTMFKVFRRECLEELELESNGFDLDIELVCKLVKNGHAPIEVPVNYVSRDFEEGKKISFVRDALPSYLAFFRYRLG
ncbi:MAG TPA: glycosyltransferase family 2 protein [Polyangiaceae bacterium]|nr:glycosyltransferase family 2 protein [Polyangiaceae bacterium]